MADANIPRFRAERAVVPGTYDKDRRPGSSGQRYFSDMQYANPNIAPRVFEDDKAGYETQAAYDTRFDNSMDAAVNAARATNTAQANQFGLANLANPARGTRPSAQTLTDAEVIKTFTDIQNNPAYNTERKQIGQSVGAMNRYNVSPERASSLMNVPLSDVNEMMGPYYREFGEAKPEGIANLLSKQTELVSEASRRLPVGSYFLGAGQTAGQTAGETTAENQQALGSQALYEALMENAYNIGNETTGGTTSGTTGATGTTTGGTTNSESWRDLITNAQAQSISSDVRNILNTARDPNEISNQITRLLTGVDSPYSGIPSAAVFNVVRQAAGVPEGQNLTDFYNDFETRPTMRRFYTETGIVPSFASTVDRRDGYSEQDIANAAFYLNSGYLTADQVANRLRQNQQGVEGLDVTGEDVNRYLGDYNTRTDLNLLGQNVVPEGQQQSNRMAQGGLASVAPQGQGYYLGGPTDGMADQIPATIDNRQPAALSDGEFVVPADVVSHLGNGNSNSGAQHLYGMMDKVRKARTGNSEQGRQIDANKFLA